jgi:pyruvate/2-oxoglutarate/acetoin dehydrogenase E1 component
MEGGIGPVAGSCHHSIFTRMPGMFVCAPFTPNEYREVWDWFMRHDEPLYVSEHRKSFNIDYEIKDIRYEYADITLFCISATRLYALEAVKVLREEYGLWVNLVNLVWLKPFAVKDEYIEMLNASKYGGLIIDDDFINGCMKTIAYDLMTKTKVPIGVLGLDERAAGFVASKDNLCPDTDKIVNKVTQIIRDQL